jgi:hypothetical protein
MKNPDHRERPPGKAGEPDGRRVTLVGLVKNNSGVRLSNDAIPTAPLSRS